MSQTTMLPRLSPIILFILFIFSLLVYYIFPSYRSSIDLISQKIDIPSSTTLQTPFISRYASTRKCWAKGGKYRFRDSSSGVGGDDGEGREKVPLEIHIMSKCPDAQDCLESLIAPALEEIEPIVDFRMSFIGRSTETGVSCLHGPSECLGNMLHLCAAQLQSPPTPPPAHTYLPFSLCLTHEYPRIPDEAFIKSCAKDSGIPFDKLNGCVSDVGSEGGLELLKKSVERSHEVGAVKSCTVRIDGDVWCIRDGREWKDCPGGSTVGDLVEHVEKIYRKGGKGKLVRGSRGED